ncbi:MAG TPA: hypothetical protein PKE64_12425 [Anaerolineae bacterium]|nr:hypothetical protein [Anaerolineae bacterium]HMR64805.1 hypothetical protein [Anaerolineae bacterium]
MTKIKSLVASGLLTLTLVFVMTAMALVMSDMQSVSVDAAEPVVNTEQVEYLPLTDAVPQRDIATQQFAPSQLQ